jgi:glycosyltransferase involved in cell wall biosynthesis
MTVPAVTAVIAAYKAGAYLREAIASALAQTFSDLEVVVMDDSADIEVRRLAESFEGPRVSYRANSTRLGAARNHWTGFAAARGRYLAILNHDDIWRADFLATLVPALEEDRNLVVAFCDHEVIGPDGLNLATATAQTSQQWGRDRLAPGCHRPFHELVVRQSLPVAMGAVFRRAAVHPDRLPDVGPAYDLWLAYALAQGGAGAWYNPRRLTGWRIHPAQLTAQADRDWAEGTEACWRAMQGDPAFKDYGREVRRKLSASAVGAARVALAGGDEARSRGFARAAVRADPLNWKAWGACGLCYLPAGALRRALPHD